MYVAAVPKGRFHCPFQIQTRSPTRLGSTPGPTRSTTPAPSLCGIIRSATMGREPDRVFQSEGFTPEACTRMRTSPAPGTGSGMSPHCRTSRAGPLRSYQLLSSDASLDHSSRYTYASRLWASSHNIGTALSHEGGRGGTVRGGCGARIGLVTLGIFTCQGGRHGPKRVTHFQRLSGLAQPRLWP
jgi:hypothetical protein